MEGQRVRASQLCENIPQELVCLNCYSISTSFAKSTTCNHLLCQVCYMKSKRSNSLCPICSTSFHDSISQEEREILVEKISQLSVSCPKHCGEKVAFASLENHFKNSCINELVPCPIAKCSRTMRRELLSAHVKQCQFSPATCEGCGVAMVLGQLHQHEKVHHCVAISQRREILRQWRTGMQQKKEQEEDLRMKYFEIKHFERTREKHYTIDRVKRNPVDFPRTFAISCLEKGQGGTKRSQQNLSVEVLHQLPTCTNCGHRFSIEKNSGSSCHWHMGPILKVFGGMCQTCGRLTNMEGCCVGYHILPPWWRGKP